MDFSAGNGSRRSRWSLKMAFLLLLLLGFGQVSWGRRRGSFSRHKLEIKSHLRSLNKRAIKSIKSPDGDIIDCVRVAHQPAFDHPLLKNHTIQKWPDFHPEGLSFGESKTASKSNPVTQLWHLKGRCPKGTIPIRRTRMHDVARARSSVKSYGRKKSQSVAQPSSAEPDLVNQSGHQHAIVYVEGDKYYGAKGTINVWSPSIQHPNEFSLSQIWVLGGTFGEDLNSIEAGWQVSPDLYGDNNTRLFTYWTSDAYQATGCYNLLCSGFIQINNEIAMGASIYPLSSYRSSQYDISILIWKVEGISDSSADCTWAVVFNHPSYDKFQKLITNQQNLIGFIQPTTYYTEDPKEGNWWMQFGNGYVLGYWPSFLFSYLADSASMIEWGGEVVNSESEGEHTSTEMGSGHFSEEGFGKAGYFRSIQYVDGSNNLRVAKDVGTFMEQPNCYDVQTGKSDDWGSYFFYGGPGKNPNCP